MVQEHRQPDASACLPPEMLLRHVFEPEGLTEEQCEEISLHVAQCNRCARTYNAMCAASLEHIRQARMAAGIPEPEPVSALEVEESLARTRQRIHALEAAERRQRCWKLVWRIGRIAAAACLLIAIGIGWAMMHKGQSDRPQPPIAANNGSPAVFAELMTSHGREPLVMNQPIATNDHPQEILLSGMHRVVMNRHTKATFAFEPRRTEGLYADKIPYQIQLAQGELYVEVVPGNPFTVQTTNARLDITGTKFDVVADGDKTKLTLLKGSIRFSALDRPHEAVSVTTGHASIVTGRLAPTAPAPANALAITAWARDAMLRNAIASKQDKYASDPDLQWLMTMGRSVYRYQAPADVDTEDYDAWLKKHPQPRQTLNAFAALQRQQTIEADWIEVMMISGDIWQFHYDPKQPLGQSFTKLEPQSISRLARHYGLDEKEILKALGLPESALATMPVQNGAPGQRYAEALRHWHDAVTTAIPVQDKPDAHTDLKFFSFTAGHYLAETRTAAYLWAKNNPEKARQFLGDKEYLAMLPTPPALASNEELDIDAWFKQLHDEANAARSLASAAVDWLHNEPPNTCPGQPSEQQTLLAKFIGELMLTSYHQDGKP